MIAFIVNNDLPLIGTGVEGQTYESMRWTEWGGSGHISPEKFIILEHWQRATELHQPYSCCCCCCSFSKLKHRNAWNEKKRNEMHRNRKQNHIGKRWWRCCYTHTKITLFLLLLFHQRCCWQQNKSESEQQQQRNNNNNEWREKNENKRHTAACTVHAHSRKMRKRRGKFAIIIKMNKKN